MSLTYKARHKSIAPEHFQEKVWYAITININNSEYKTIEKRTFEYFELLAKIKYIQYELWFELSQIGKLHLHGRFKIINKSDIAKFFAFDMCVLTTTTAFEIDTIGNGEDDLKRSSEKTIGEDHQEDGPEKSHMDKWLTYCKKSEQYMKPFMEEYNLPWRVINIKVDSILNKTIKLTPSLKTFFSQDES